VVSLLHALALAPTINLADALAVVAAKREGIEYGWARGAGSAAFIVGSIAAGFMASAFGIWIVVVLQAMMMLAVPLASRLVPQNSRPTTDRISQGGLWALLRLAVFRRVVLVSALVLGSHALHDTFSIIRWTNAGISSQAAGLLWSIAVAAEVVMFFVSGPWLLARLKPAHAMAIAALAGAVRWFISALPVNLTALVFIQPLHGITFALMHLACMRILATSVPPGLAATAQAIYGTVGIGAATALLTLASGWLYSWLGGLAFFAMGLLCIAALPVVFSQISAEQDAGS
jgi:PPP family 3-phenylpropionic acid transporter